MSHPNRTCEFHFPGVARRRIGISHQPDLHFVRVPAAARRRVYLARNVAAWKELERDVLRELWQGETSPAGEPMELATVPTLADTDGG